MFGPRKVQTHKHRDYVFADVLCGRFKVLVVEPRSQRSVVRIVAASVRYVRQLAVVDLFRCLLRAAEVSRQTNQ